jgi:hypothetical protein
MALGLSDKVLLLLLVRLGMSRLVYAAVQPRQ